MALRNDSPIPFAFGSLFKTFVVMTVNVITRLRSPPVTSPLLESLALGTCLLCLYCSLLLILIVLCSVCFNRKFVIHQGCRLWSRCLFFERTPRHTSGTYFLSVHDCTLCSFCRCTVLARGTTSSVLCHFVNCHPRIVGIIYLFIYYATGAAHKKHT